MRRGLLIVFEGTDRCGKSTQCQRLVQSLNAKRPESAKLMRFPERDTEIGQMIDKYLTKQVELSDEAAHLLFSANRWELVDGMKTDLAAGKTLVIDRYAFSGVAFTSAKGLDMGWCKQPDAGLPVPDLLLHFELDPEEAEKRGGYGRERYEVSDFQKVVKKKFSDLYATLEQCAPVVVDVTGKSIDDVAEIVMAYVRETDENEEAIGAVSEMKTLW